jgi:hypothetical protein
MGQFSWLDCVDDKRAILDDVRKTSYVLIPKEFGGGHIAEPCYDGYGNFGGTDIYDLIPVWNKAMIPEIIRRAKNGHWIASINEEQLTKFYNGEEIDVPLRYLGIEMACYDEDNASLEYPLKVTYHEDAVYEDCKPSLSDPNQGWG